MSNVQTTDIRLLSQLVERTNIAGNEKFLIEGSDNNLYYVTRLNLTSVLGIDANTAQISANVTALLQRELLANKKTSLAENSDTFYPTQRAVRTVTDNLSSDDATLQQQINDLIIDSGTSDAETIQARTSGETGDTYAILKDRLDAQESRSLVYDDSDTALESLQFIARDGKLVIKTEVL